jgi:SAM-dependent methyltransferase
MTTEIDYTKFHNDGNANLLDKMDYGSPWILANHLRYALACQTVVLTASKIKSDTPRRTFHLLDVGSSSATFGRFWKKSYSSMSRPRLSITGLEINPVHIKKAAEFEATIDAFAFAHRTIKHDLITQSLPTDPVDLILAQEVIEHIPREAGARLVQEAYDRLPDHGVLIISTPAPRKDEGEEFVFPQDHLFEYSRSELERLVVDAGFKIHKQVGWCGKVADIKKYGTPEAYELYLRLKANITQAVAVSTIAALYPETASCQTLILKK